MDSEMYCAFGNQRRKGVPWKICEECKREYFRGPLECNANWKKRKTCGGECRRKRKNRIRKENK